MSLSHKFKPYTTVAEALDGDVILVGEEHGNRECKRLAARVLREVQPPTVAVEMGPNEVPPRGAGMGALVSYAEENDDVPCLHIDEPNVRISKKCREAGANWHELLQKANKFSHPIKSGGDLNPAAIRNARSRVANQFGQQVHYWLYEYREQSMAKSLRDAVEDYETPILAGIGAFHINALQRELAEPSLPAEGFTEAQPA